MHLATPTNTLLASPLLTLIAAAAAKGKGKPRDAIALAQVQTLTLRGHDALTTSRRVSAIPQTKCISHPSLCALVEPKLDVVRCENMGSSYGDADVEWSCSATLPEELRLGSTDVICEGYESADDPFVLKGSCGLEYRVVLTDKGEQRYPDLSMVGRKEAQAGEGGTWAPFLFFLGVVGIMVLLSYLNGTGANQNERRPRRLGGGGGGGNGWGGGGGGGGFDPDFGGFQDEDEAPPPYPGGRKSQSGSSRQTRSQTAQEGWRPGFWSGLAAGGAATYAASRAGGRSSQQQDDNRGGSWGRRSGQSSSSGSGAGASGTSYESTGFGSTSRR